MTVRKKRFARKKDVEMKNKMPENRIAEEIASTPVNGNGGSAHTTVDIPAATDIPPGIETKKKLTEAESLAVQILQEREKQVNLVIEANELNNQIEALQQEVRDLKRQLYQERINSILKENDTTRSKFSLPKGNAQYAIEDGEMYLVTESAK